MAGLTNVMVLGNLGVVAVEHVALHLKLHGMGISTVAGQPEPDPSFRDVGPAGHRQLSLGAAGSLPSPPSGWTGEMCLPASPWSLVGTAVCGSEHPI